MADVAAQYAFPHTGADERRRLDLFAEFYQLSMTATAQPLISAGVVTAADAARLTARLGEPDFLACGFAFIGAWSRRDG
jgi:hypothetical protein